MAAVSTGAGASTGKHVLLVTTVDIGGGATDKIEFCKGDDPTTVANTFVIKHGLPHSIVGPLTNHILDNLKKANIAIGDAKAGDAKGKAGDVSGLHEKLYQESFELRDRLEEKRRAQEAAFEELVNTSKPPMSWVSQEMMRGRTAGPFDNYGEMLYAESLEAMARKKQKEVKRHEEVVEKETDGATFHPEVSQFANALWANANVAPAWQRLSNSYKPKTKERLQMLKKEKEDAEVRECTFRPRINHVSDRLMSERSETLRSLKLSAHEQLFQDAVRRQLKQQEYANWFPEEVTFRPKTNESSTAAEYARRSWEKDLKAAGIPERSAVADLSGKPDVVQRLYASYEKSSSRKAEVKAKLEGGIDPATGKQMFRPATGRSPAFSRNTGGLPVGEYLYSIASDMAQKKVSAVEAELRKEEEERCSTHPTAKSSSLQGKLKRKRFKQVFEFLDEGGVGLVDLVSLVAGAPVMMDVLDDEVRADVEAAARLYVKHMRAASGRGYDGDDDGALYPPIDLEKFYGLMEGALLARRGPRSYIAPSPPQKFRASDSFQPKINRTSAAMVSRSRPKEASVFELLYREAEHQSSKIEEMRKARCDDDIKECTFKPALVSEALVGESLVRQYIQTGTVPALARTRAQGSPKPEAVAPAEGGGYAAASPAGAAAGLLDDAKYEELEREVQEMLAATSMASAAIERLPSRSDQVYLTRILGLSSQQGAYEAAAHAEQPPASAFSARS